MRIINLYKLLRYSSVCLLLAMVAGCAESVDFEQPQLSVSEKEIKFTNQISEKTITVNTNCKEWIATTPKQWVHLTQNGNEIIVKADANTSGIARNSYILVDGGLAVEKIMVNQSAADLSLDIAKQEAQPLWILIWKGVCTKWFRARSLIGCRLSRRRML